VKFLIAETFTDSLGRLTSDEQKVAKTTAFDLQTNPKQPGLQFHKLDRAKDPRFWSVRGTRDLRLIVHRTEDALLLCYAGHHDDAYDWAERRKIEIHPKTGAAQIVVVRETVQEIPVPKYVEVPLPASPKAKLFAGIPDDELLGFGVPTEWLNDVRGATEDTYLALSDHLPREAAEALLELATGGKPEPAPMAIAGADPFQHPDAMRRFRVMHDVEELARAMEFPWEKWTIFLHPAQRALVERTFNGPARVAGSAGTGKTIVALHRATFLARTNPDSRVLLATFSEPLANALRTKLRRLIGNEPLLGERIEVHSLDSIGRRLYELNVGRIALATKEGLKCALRDAALRTKDGKFSPQFLFSEWQDVVDAWQLDSWESYRDVVRLGRKTRLPEKQRASLWSIFDDARNALRDRGEVTVPQMYSQLASKLKEKGRAPFDYIVVDEAQDLSVAQLRFLAAFGGTRPNALFCAGDLGQRIFQQPFSWKALGVDVSGRSFRLKINYRTSHQIRNQADRLLDPELSDVDGIVEKRNGTISTFNGDPPEVAIAGSAEEEVEAVAAWIGRRSNEGVVPHEIGVFVRSEAQLDRARAAIERAGLQCNILNENVQTISGLVSIGTMHLAKGLEFRSVAVMACDDEVLPLQERIESVGDDADLAEVYATERHLLYVACTRARDHLLVTGVDPASEFLDDLRQG
jgi:superfamily I DNA/RNA helicase/mRNA-degrading endonuclease RelE of RelBE toxin-antitoxin system